MLLLLYFFCTASPQLPFHVKAMYGNLSIALMKSMEVPTPSYVQVTMLYLNIIIGNLFLNPNHN